MYTNVAKLGIFHPSNMSFHNVYGHSLDKKMKSHMFCKSTSYEARVMVIVVITNPFTSFQKLIWMYNWGEPERAHIDRDNVLLAWKLCISVMWCICHPNVSENWNMPNCLYSIKNMYSSAQQQQPVAPFTARESMHERSPGA